MSKPDDPPVTTEWPPSDVRRVLEGLASGLILCFEKLPPELSPALRGEIVKAYSDRLLDIAEQRVNVLLREAWYQGRDDG